MANRKEIIQIVGIMSLAYSNYKPMLDGELTTVDLLEDLLGDLPVDELKLALKACILEPGRAFAPAPGEIRGKVAQMRLAANNTPTAGEAWAEVMDHIKYKGCQAKPEWSHPIIGKAVDAIGLVNIGMAEDNGMVARAHFMKLFPVYLERETGEIAQHPQIAAYINEQWQLNGATSIKQLADKMGVKE